MLRNKFFIFLLLISFIEISCVPGDVPANLEVVGVQNPEISLNGVWKFNMNPPEKFWNNDIDFSDWSTIQVPGECQMQGFAIRKSVV